VTHACERVLVVNDDSLVLESLRDVLSAAGIDARTAQSAEEAADILDAGFRPSAVLLARTPIIAISASPWRLRRVEDDVQATLEVPFSLEELERTLAEICAEAAA
jgi:hypothetical protein